MSFISDEFTLNRLKATDGACLKNQSIPEKGRKMCEVCGLVVNSKHMSRHLKSKSHISNLSKDIISLFSFILATTEKITFSCNVSIQGIISYQSKSLYNFFIRNIQENFTSVADFFHSNAYPR